MEIPKQVEKILKYNPGEKSLKAPFAIYLDLEWLLKKEQSYTEKKAKHDPSGWAMFTRCSFSKKENTLNYYRGKDCIEKLCKKLKECAMKIINYEEKEMIPLTKEENTFYKKQEAYHIWLEKFFVDKDDESYVNRKKVKDHCHYTGKVRGAAHSKCNLNYRVTKDIPIIIHNAGYDTHFIINQLAAELHHFYITVISLFLYQLTKNVVMIKRFHAN